MHMQEHGMVQGGIAHARGGVDWPHAPGRWRKEERLGALPGLRSSRGCRSSRWLCSRDGSRRRCRLGGCHDGRFSGGWGCCGGRHSSQLGSLQRLHHWSPPQIRLQQGRGGGMGGAHAGSEWTSSRCGVRKHATCRSLKNQLYLAASTAVPGVPRPPAHLLLLAKRLLLCSLVCPAAVAGGDASSCQLCSDRAFQLLCCWRRGRFRRRLAARFSGFGGCLGICWGVCLLQRHLHDDGGLRGSSRRVHLCPTCLDRCFLALTSCCSGCCRLGGCGLGGSVTRSGGSGCYRCSIGSGCHRCGIGSGCRCSGCSSGSPTLASMARRRAIVIISAVAIIPRICSAVACGERAGNRGRGSQRRQL